MKYIEVVKPVSARVINIVDDGGDEAGGLVDLVAVLLHPRPVEEAGGGVEDVSRVRRVVVRVPVVVGLEQCKPVLHRRLGALEHLRHLEPQHGRHSQPHEAPEMYAIGNRL